MNVIIMYCVCAPGTLENRILMAFHIYNHKNQHKGDISKTELNHILNLYKCSLYF